MAIDARFPENPQDRIDEGFGSSAKSWSLSLRGKSVRLLRLMLAMAVVGIGSFVRADDSENHVLDGAVEITVASGTSVYSGVLSGSGSIVKKGAGKLVLSNRSNSFTGGITVKDGIVDVAAAGAAGTGAITVEANGANVRQIRFSAANATFANPISVTGDSRSLNYNINPDGAAISLANTNVVLSGSITASGDLFIRDDPTVCGGPSPSQNISLGKITGTVQVPGHTLYLNPSSLFHYTGKITAGTLDLVCASGYRGNLYLDNAANEIGTLLVRPNNTPKIYCGAAGALGGAAVKWVGQEPNNQGEIRGVIIPQSYSQSVKSLESDPYWDDGETVKARGGFIGNTSGNTCSWTITGREDVDECQFSGVLYQQNFTCILNAREGFTQVISNRTHAITTELGVNGGRLVIAGDATFKKLKCLSATGTGVLEVRETGIGAFAALASVKVSSTAVVKFPAGTKMTVSTLFIDGKQALDGVYTSANANWLQGLELTVTDGPPAPSASDLSWSNASGDERVDTPANWNGTAPDTWHGYFASARPVFAVSGSRAQLGSGVTWFNGIKFKGPDFTLEPAAGVTDASVSIYRSVETSDADPSLVARYEIKAPLEIRNDIAFTATTNKTLVFSGGIASQAPRAVSQLGTGTVELVNYQVPGGYAHTKGGTLKIVGELGVAGDTGLLEIKNADYWIGADGNNYDLDEKGSKIYRCRPTGETALSNAVIRKEVKLSSCGQISGSPNTGTWLSTCPGTTNVFKEIVKQGASMCLTVGQDSQIVFEKGYSDVSTSSGGGFNLAQKVGTTGGQFVFKGPVRLLRPDKGTMSMYATSTRALGLRFESAGNMATNYVNFNYLNVEFAVDEAFEETKFFRLEADSNVIDLLDTHQSIPYFWCTKGKFRGVYPATLEITKGLANATQAATTNFTPTTMSGWLGFTKSGDGYQNLGVSGRAYESYGDIEVTGGTLNLVAGMSWLNGTNVTVRGTGTLKLNSANVFGKQAVLRLAENGVVSIPDNTVLRVSEGWLGDQKLAAGNYSYATAPAALKAHLDPETTGVLSIVAGGTLLLFR